MSNLEQAQEFGRYVLDKIKTGAPLDIIMVGMLETCMEYLANILDELRMYHTYQPKLPQNYEPDEDSMRRRDKIFWDIEQLGIKHNPDGSMEVSIKQKEDA